MDGRRVETEYDMTEEIADGREPSVSVDDDTLAGRDLSESDQAYRTNKLSKLFVRFLFSAGKTVQIHDLENRAARNVLSDLMEILDRFMNIEGRVSLKIMADFLYINDVRVSLDPMNFGLFLFLIEEMKKRKVEQIDFLPGITYIGLGTFLKLFFGEVAADDVFGDLQRRITQERIEHVNLVEWMEQERRLKDSTVDEKNVREESNKVFFRAVLFMAEVLKSIEQRRVVQVRKAERLAQQIFDILQVDDSILIGLTNIKNFDEYTFAHSVNVCILSMMLGERLRLRKDEVARLGVAALLHDIGKMYIPRSILNKPGKLTAEEWELMKYHTMFGVKELSRIKSLREIADSLHVSLMHHIHYNMNGYPQKPRGWDLLLFPRIVIIADYYDAMTTSRVYHREALTPDKALRFVFDKSGTIFDPLLAKVFIKAMGIYPNGTVVELDTGELAVVVRQNESVELLHRPVAVPLKDGERGDWEDNRIDLADKKADGKSYRTSIVRAVIDKTTELQKSACFLNP
jgi:putative nucleotidyltransferase with HDIG domain